MVSQFANYQQPPYIALPTGKSKLRWNDEPIDYTQVPSLLWNPAYDHNHEELYRKIQHVMDYLMLCGSGVYSPENPNTPKCREAYKGIIDPREYDVADSFYGKPGSAKMKDFGFFHSLTQRVLGGALQSPFKFRYMDVSPVAMQRRLKAQKAQLDESFRRQLADAMTRAAEEAGHPADFSFLTNASIALPQDGIFTPPTQSVEERVGHSLLIDTTKRFNTKEEFHYCREDAIQLNARMAHIVTDKRGTRPQRLDPDRVHWIAPGPIKTDLDCDAIGTWDYPSIAEILNQDGHLFENSGTLRGLTDTVEQLRAGAPFWYNPRQYWLAGETQRVQPGDRESALYLPAMWQDKFYPGSDAFSQLNGQSIGVLRHQIYFKMIRFLRVKVLLNGRKPTPEMLREWRFRNYKGEIDVRYIPMDDDEAAKPGDVVEKIPLVQLWQARRYGHNTIQRVQRCTHVPNDPFGQQEVRSPIVIRMSYKRSMIALGLDFRRMWNILWNRIEEQLNLGGAESALLIDTAQLSMKESKALMWQAKKTAVAHYNSSRLQSNANDAAKKHLTRVQLTSETNTVNNMLSLAGLLKSVYDAMIGYAGGGLGQASPYDAANKLAFLQNQQTAMTTEFAYDDNLFQNDVMQRTAEIQKTVAVGNSYAEVSLDGATSGRVASSKRQYQPLYIPPTMNEVEPLVEVDNGMDLMNIRQKIEGMAERVLPSGGAGGIREFIRLLFEDDPYEALSIFDAGMSEVEKAEAANAKAQSENARMKNEVEAQKAQVPIETMKMRTEADILIAQGKQQQKAQEQENKGDLHDIDAQNRREEMALQSQLNTQSQGQLQAQDAGNQLTMQQLQAEIQAANQDQPDE